MTITFSGNFSILLTLRFQAIAESDKTPYGKPRKNPIASARLRKCASIFAPVLNRT